MDNLDNLPNAFQGVVSVGLGAKGATPLIGPVTVSHALGALIVVILVMIVHFLAARLTKSSAESKTTLTGPDASYLRSAIRRPIYVMIWATGLYFAVRPVLSTLLLAQQALLIEAGSFLVRIGAVAAIVWCLIGLSRLLELRLMSWPTSAHRGTAHLLVPLFGTTLRIAAIVLGISIGIPLLGIPDQYADFVSKVTSLSLIVAVAVLVSRMISIVQSAVLLHFDMAAADNLRARTVYTQIQVVSRVLYALVVFLAVAAALMSFKEVRQFGTSLLASAGIVGIIAGVAAQKTLANLLAGFQIALAQPVRQDDVVVVEGEWGKVEEITLSYVVVHIWDDRRLILPLSYFIEKPFQNWTRNSAQITGSVLIWVDYLFPVHEGRKALKDIVENSPLWDRRFWNLQVSDSTDKAIQLRVLATSADSSRSWDLRCEIREGFLAYIQQHHPQSLPRLRADVT